MGKKIENNNVNIIGIITEEFCLSHEAYGEKFYSSMVACKRLSGTTDFVPIIVSGRLIDTNEEWIGKRVKVSGTFRTYDQKTENGIHLILYVFADEIEDEEIDEKDINNIYIDGYICKKAVYRKTPLGREISDIMLAVNRSYGKSDYIPCISWGRGAIFASKLDVGSRVCINGRIQSRDYKKRLGNGEYETRTIYEVSAKTIEFIEEREEKENERSEN